MSNTHETILYVNLKTLEDNYNFLKNTFCKQNKVIAVVKAFAYGLGDVEVAKKLESLGVDGFWVADFEEGVHLRKNGVSKPIMVANPGFKSKSIVLEYDLEPVIYSHRMLDLYCSAKAHVNVHIKFNTGMNRYGFNIEDVDELVKVITANKYITIKSICSHLSSSNDKHYDTFSNNQIDKLKLVGNRLESALGTTLPKHILNSNGILRFTSNKGDWVRLGICLYGGLEHPNLSQIFTLQSVINQIRQVEAGDSIGYQHSFTVKKNMQIAIVPVGYADGINRKLGHSKGRVLINNRPCSILGEISMDSMIVDITNTKASEGDDVIIFSPEQSVVSLSNSLGTISYEIMATLNRRIKRIYLNE